MPQTEALPTFYSTSLAKESRVKSLSLYKRGRSDRGRSFLLFGLLLQGRHKRPLPGVLFADLSSVGLMTEIKRLSRTARWPERQCQCLVSDMIDLDQCPSQHPSSKQSAPTGSVYRPITKEIAMRYRLARIYRNSSGLIAFPVCCMRPTGLRTRPSAATRKHTKPRERTRMQPNRGSNII